MMLMMVNSDADNEIISDVDGEIISDAVMR